MNYPLPVVLFIISVTFGLSMAMFDLIGGSIYDFKEIRKQRRFLQNRRKQKRYKPPISIIIPAHNEETVIKRCLASLLTSSYKNYEIIVVDDASKDNTKKVVKAFIAEHPRASVKLLIKRKNAGRGGAINAGFKKHAKGELIMALDADCTLDKMALERAVRHFTLEDVSALAANVRIMPYPSILGLLQQFEWLTSFRAKKFNTLANAEYIIGGSGAVYRREVFIRLKGFNESMWTEDIALSLAIAELGNKQFRLKYASDVLVHTEPVPSYKSLFKQRYRWKLGSLQALFAHKGLFFAIDRQHSKMLSWFRLPLVIWGELMLLLEPFLITYFIYLAVYFKKPELYAIGWAIVSAMLLLIVWGDEHFSLRNKLRLTFFIPLMYSLFYIMTFIQIAAIFKSIFNFKKITGRSPIKGNWDSPERLAQPT